MIKGLTKALLWLTFVLSLLSSTSWAQSTDGAEIRKQFVINLLLDDDPAKSRVGARSIDHLPNDTEKQPFTDLIAEHLLAVATPNALPSIQVDNLGWHVNVLARTDMPRYRSVLSRARQIYTAPKLVERIDRALANAPNTQGQSYMQGSVNLATAKAESARRLAAYRKPDRSQFSKQQSGESMDEVLGALGTPDDIGGVTTRIGSYGRTQLLALHYAKTGFVLFNAPRGEGRQWTSIEFVDELFDAQAAYSGPQFALAQSIAGLRGLTFRDLTDYDAKRIIKDPAMMKVLELRLLKATHAADKYERGAMQRCVRLIAQMGGPDAMASLQRIQAQSTEKAVKKEAAEYLRKLQENRAIESDPEVGEEGDKDGDA